MGLDGLRVGWGIEHLTVLILFVQRSLNSAHTTFEEMVVSNLGAASNFQSLTTSYLMVRCWFNLKHINQLFSISHTSNTINHQFAWNTYSGHIRREKIWLWRWSWCCCCCWWCWWWCWWCWWWWWQCIIFTVSRLGGKSQPLYPVPRPKKPRLQFTETSHYIALHCTLHRTTRH